MTTVSEQIVTSKNYDTMTKAAQKASSETSTSSSSVSSDDFLNLMCMQLEYQDPTNPTDNSEMLAQEAQFASLESMEKLTSSFSSFSSIYQANSLMGKTVEVTHDGDSFTGSIDYVDFSDTSGASVSINGTTYPLSEISKVYPDNANTSSSTSDTTTGETLNSLKSTLENIGDGVVNIANKLANYIN